MYADAFQTSRAHSYRVDDIFALSTRCFRVDESCFLHRAKSALLLKMIVRAEQCVREIRQKVTGLGLRLMHNSCRLGQAN